MSSHATQELVPPAKHLKGDGIKRKHSQPLWERGIGSLLISDKLTRKQVCGEMDRGSLQFMDAAGIF